jgi:hypothetical protein
MDGVLEKAAVKRVSAALLSRVALPELAPLSVAGFRVRL